MDAEQETVNVRMMKEEDCKEAAEIERESFSCPWSEQTFLDTLKMTDAFYLVAERISKTGGKKLLGYVGVWQSFEEATITNVAVSPGERGRGIGWILLQETVKEALFRGIAALTLEVRVSNYPAIHLYEKAGFVSEGIRPGYYEKPREDAMIMWNRSLRGITIEKQKNYPV